ncbi:response regulator [Massilia sp. S19_KUP03_FR1]|uniref:response regulator n=1 Tax=Massilia sp. S19_KUP03_FR1 TaxID=3025503 RepID=UPI002FCD030C
MALFTSKNLATRQQLEWVALAMIFVAVGAAGFVSHNVETQRALDTERLRLVTLVDVVGSDMALNLDAMDRALVGVVRDHPDHFGAANQVSIQRHLRAITDAMPGMRGATMIDTRGVVIAGFPLDLIGRDFSDRYFYTAPKARPDANTLYISHPYVSIRKDVIVTASRLIPGASGAFNGTINGILNPLYFSERMRSVLYAPDVKAWMGHSGGATFVSVATPGYDSAAQQSRFSASFLFQPLKPLSVQRTVAPLTTHSDNYLLIGISRDPHAVVAPMLRQGKMFALFLTALTILCCALLAVLQLRRRRWLRDNAAHEVEQAEADALRLSEARFRTLIEEAPVAIAIVRQGRFVYTNRRYNVLHGYTDSDELAGLPWSALIAADSLDGLKMQASLINADSPTELRFEVMGIGNTGSLIPMFKATTRVALRDGPVTLIFAQDISAQKRAEAFLLEARDAAQAANQSKAEFLANMSHEIRTPLNAILGLAYLLEQSGLGHDAGAMLVKIRSSGRSLLGIINDVLDVSKIEAGAMVVEHTWLRLQDVIDSVAATMGVAVGEKPVQLLVHPLPPGVSSIKGDALRLEQLLVNLTSNAIKFTIQGHVELSVQHGRAANGARTLRFCVTDTGIGIVQSLQEAVFTPFTQADSSTTRRFGGSGLGLTICKKMVELMGGQIGLSSTVGVGSSFWFTLPLQSIADADFSSAEMVQLDAIVACNHGGALANLDATGRTLGWKVCAVESPQEALMELTRRAGTGNDAAAKLPAVIVLDWERNGSDCIAVARAMRQIAPSDQCPIVVMACTAAAAALKREQVDGVIDALLTKPVTASTLHNAAVAARRKRANAGVDVTPRVPAGCELAGLHILVVDDSDINRDVAQRILQEKGASVALAEDGQRAIAWLLAHPDTVDLVLMDVQMPVLDGIEATRQLRAMPRFANLPIVALTAGAFKSHHEAARAAGMTHFVTKPFDIPLTIDLILQLTGRAGATGVATAAHVSAVATPAPRLTVIDLQRGIDIWGDVETYQLYLRKFAASFATCASEIKARAAAGDLAGAASMAHKLAGAAANVALQEVAQLAMEAERQLAGYGSEGAGTPHDSLICSNLEEALLAALGDIAQLAPLPHPVAPTPVARPSAQVLSERVAPLLLQLLEALHQDNPGPSAPVLQALNIELPGPDVWALGALIEAFDFRGAEHATHALAQRLHLQLPEPFDATRD